MKKFVLILLSVGLLAVAVVGCGGTGVTPGGAAGNVEPAPMPEADPVEDAPDLVIDDGDAVLPGIGSDILPGNDGAIAFMSVSGIIVSVEIIEGLTHVEIEDTDGNPAILVLNDETVFPFSTDFAVGDEVTGWYCANSPMIMIWPPQYAIEVFSSRMGDDRNIKVDRIHASDISADRFFISQDGMFMFNMDDNTEIVLQDGQDFSDGDLEGRRIVVIYGASTRSIPEQATADKLIVLFEGITPLA